MRRQGAAVRADTAGSDPFKGAADQLSADSVADAVCREGGHGNDGRVLCLRELVLDAHVAAHFLGIAEVDAPRGKFLVVFMTLAGNEI